jgi:hypothetical protein
MMLIIIIIIIILIIIINITINIIKCVICFLPNEESRKLISNM